MQRWLRPLFQGIEWVIGLGLAVMVLLVLGNVVLRYGFNSGITLSEEVARWIFIWITFLGAVVALHEHGHLGVDMLVQRLPAWGKKLCLLASHLAMLGMAVLLGQGSWAQVRINWEVSAPVTGASMAIVYLPGLVFAAMAVLVLLGDLARLLGGRLADDELVLVQESEESVQLQQILGRQDGEGRP